MRSYVEIELDQMEAVESIRRRNNHILSSHSFTSLFIWKEDMRLRISLKKDYFVVNSPSGCFFPCGSDDAKYRFIKEEAIPQKLPLLYMSENDVAFMQLYFPNVYTFFSDRNASEYIYSVKEQTELSGSKFSAARKKIRHAKAAENYRCEPISKDNINEARDIIIAWNSLHTDEKGGFFGDTSAALLCVDNFSELGLSGIIVYGENESKAFVIGSPITADTYDLHIAKCRTHDAGLDCLQKYMFYLSLVGKYAYVNREEDLGIEGIRMQKTEARPVRMNNIWKGKII